MICNRHHVSEKHDSSAKDLCRIGLITSTEPGLWELSLTCRFLYCVQVVSVSSLLDLLV